mgnify:CR=1 FL=1
MSDNNEIVLYQPDALTKIDVCVADETVWLTQQQLAMLFGTEVPAISKHIRNIYKSEELNKSATLSKMEIVQTEGNRTVRRKIDIYNLDMILSVGYRVNSRNASRFRQWANQVLKDYLLRGYAVNQRLFQLEQKMDNKFASIDRQLAAHKEQIDFFVRTSLPPVEGVFYDGQIFDAYTFAADLIKSAKKRIVLIDNYIDETVLTLLDKRIENVSATIYTHTISKELQLDITKHNAQYPPIEVYKTNLVHDRFLIVDDTTYHIGASIKDLGKKLFAFSRMEIKPEDILSRVL